MRRSAWLLVMSVGLILAGVNSPYAQRRGQLEDALRRDIQRARDRVFPALVNILTVARYFEGGRAQYGIGGGSGVIVSPDGLVLTNYHVAENSSRLFCTLSSGERFEAKVVVHDPLTDLSVLKIQLPPDQKERKFAYAELGDSDALNTGDYVLAMGNPLLLSSSVTLGIVSNPRRVFVSVLGDEIESVEFEQGDRSGLLTRWVQHDALILPGNSGGPLVNLRGEVVGINQLGGRGLGFAIPSNIAKRVLEQVVRKGKIERAWLGFRALPVEKLRRTTGVLVGSVSPESAAEKAGLKAGDIVLAIDGKPTNARFAEEIPLIYQLIADLPIGKPVSVVIERAGVRQTLTMTPELLEPYYRDEDEIRTLGISIRDITRPMARARRLPKEGVLITGIRPGYPVDSAEPKIQIGDAIIQVGDTPVRTIQELKEALNQHKDKELIPLTVQRREEVILSAVRNKPPADPSPNTELPRAWLGVRTQVMTRQVVEAIGQAELKGFRITEVLPYTEASRAGLQVGDILIALNGEPLEAYRPQDARDLERRIEQLPIGEEATLTLLRNGEQVEIKVKMEPSPASAESAKVVRQRELEFSVRDITPIDRMRNRWAEDQQGVLVTDVANGSWAQLGGLRPGDLILAINEQTINNTQDFQSVTQEALEKQPPILVVFIRRDRETTFAFIEPDWKDIKQP